MVSIEVKGNIEANEYQDALALKSILARTFGEGVNGNILIISNTTLFGYQVTDIDLIVIGKLSGYATIVNTRHKRKKANGFEEFEFEKRRVVVRNFCFVIETKRHGICDIRMDGIHLKVRYNGYYSDATTQSERQKYSLKNFFCDRLNRSPFICNVIWLRNANWSSIKGLIADEKLRNHNYLPDTFSFQWLIQLACIQDIPYTPENSPYSVFNAFGKDSKLEIDVFRKTFDLFLNIREGSGQLTRKRIEQITSKLLDQQNYAQAIGEKLVVISGRAGTGKTIKLLRIACDLAMNQGARCLILTYNHALVSDIRRTLALAGIPDSIDSYTVAISTLHKFILELIKGIGISGDGPSTSMYVDFIEKYDDYLLKLQSHIQKYSGGSKRISELMISRHEQVAWDYVLVDESQDWNEREKSILFSLFGKNRIIIADGVDQLIRSQSKCNWTRGLNKDIDFRQTYEKKGLRQQVNLINFANTLAKELGVPWELDPKQELIGGKVIISTTGYSNQLHNAIYADCQKSGNTAYDLMFLVPPSMVEKVYIEGEERTRQFKYLDDFSNAGIKIWDGTRRDLRTEYPVDLAQHRLFQYESCRGLEGWAVVCLELDEFIRSKMQHFEEQETGELALETFEEKRNKFVYLWTLIPLTRAIDTLVITLKDRNSPIARSLRAVYERCRDTVHWVD